jgi:hypothetical protein
MKNISRRNFIKASVTGAAGLALARRGMGKISMAPAGAWKDGMSINSDIDNLDVVCCHDPRMLAAGMTDFSMLGQNAPVDKNAVQENLDKMARALVRKKKGDVTAEEAWRTIFRKPASKDWSLVNVAIKVNCLEPRNAPRLAVLDKLCRVLNGFGVPFGNITIYDAITSATKCYRSFIGKDPWPGLPAVVVADELGGWVNTEIRGFTRKFLCCGALLDNSVDILINVAVNKGQPIPEIANSTLSMKNHYGTFHPTGPKNAWGDLVHSGKTATDWLLGISQHVAILGGNPVRQQLCIVDSLVAQAQPGPVGIPDKRMDRLFMGTFSPAVDYIIMKRLRGPIMGVTFDEAVANRFMSDFGYTPPATYDFIFSNSSRGE